MPNETKTKITVEIIYIYMQSIQDLQMSAGISQQYL